MSGSFAPDAEEGALSDRQHGTVATTLVGEAPSPLGQIDRRSPVPFFFQVKGLLADEFDRGRWVPGDRLPSEPELCDHFGVSRSTVRQALAELEREGRLRRERGRGTFVAEPRTSAWFLQSSHGFHDEATAAGHEVTSRVLRRELVPLPSWAAVALRVPAGSEGLRVDRVRSVDGAVAMYVESYLLAQLAGPILAAALERDSLYRLLRDEAGVEVAGGRRVVEATTAREHLAEVLEVPPGAPLLHVESVSWDADERPFECYRAWHRSDRTKIAVQVVASAAAETAGIDPRTLALVES